MKSRSNVQLVFELSKYFESYFLLGLFSLNRNFALPSQKIAFFVQQLGKVFLYICIAFLCVRCAQITPLTGGKKDSSPPKVLKSVPENASVNFSTNQIEIQFDEFIILKDLANQFVITPQTKELPEIEASGKKLKITFNEALLPNTTYKLFFGNAICDIHEYTPYQNFEYILSTGNTIDSLKLSGKVIYAFDKKPADKFLIGLYDSSSGDSVIYKEKPLYISKTDVSGNFNFNYLPSKQFKLVAINDQNKNLLYDGSEEQIAFPNELVTAGDSLATTIYAFKELPNKSFILKSFSVEYGKALIIYNKAKPNFKDIKAKGLISYSMNSSKDSITCYYNNIYDTLLTYIYYDNEKTDTVPIKIQSKLIYDKQLKNGLIKYNLSSNISNGQLAFYEDPTFELNYPLSSFESVKNKTILYEIKDSTKQLLDFTLNTISPTSFSIKTNLKQETSYRLIFNKAALSDNLGRGNDSIVFNFKLTNEEDYGVLSLKLLFPEKENYLVQLLNEKMQVVKENNMEFSLTSTNEKLLQYKNLIPGKYFIKVIEDANKNGQFDTGNYLKHQQAETIYFNSTPIKLLSGWEIENEWKVN